MDGSHRIVVVDDMPDIVETISLWLAMDGYEVHGTTTATEALDLVARQQPFCVLLDLDMPGMDGATLAAELRRCHGTSLVLIAITSQFGADTALSPRFAALDHCLGKPLDLSVLRRLLPPMTRHG